MLWCIHNLVRTKKAPLSEEKYANLYFVIGNFIDNGLVTGDVSKDVLWALNYLLESENESICTMICQGKNTFKMLLSYMESALIEEYTPAIRCVG